MASGNPNEATGADTPTGLLPFNAFGGKTPEVGDVCRFRVVQIYDDQVEVEYVPHESESEESGEEPGQEPQEGEMTEYLQ